MTRSTLEVRGAQFLRGNEPHLIISGALHYFRVHPDLWEDRLKRLALMGCNTVETYVAWNFHAPASGVVSFEGGRDLGRFLDIAAELGLDAIVRPGPYICAEWENGGLPSWLTHDTSLRLRCRDEKFLAEVSRWFDQLIPIVAQRQSNRGGNVVAVQVENEYGSWGDDAQYLAIMRDMVTDRGIDELLVTSDGGASLWLSAGTVEGAYPTGNFGSRAEQVLPVLSQWTDGGPGVCMEFWNGWFDHWGEPHHDRDAQDCANELDFMLSHGMSVNFYMAHGGTNFGLWAGANQAEDYQPTTTSYDYDAPIAEDGRLTAKFHAYRQTIARYRDLPDYEAERERLGITENPTMQPRLDLQLEHSHNLRTLPLWRSEGEGWPWVPTFEEAGIDLGFQLLKREITVFPWSDGAIVPLRFMELHDRAYVWGNGVFLGVADRNDPDQEISLEPALGDVAERQSLEGTTVDLEILVENLGRVNFGPHLGDPKGVVRGIWYGVRFLNNWQVVSLSPESLLAACQETDVVNPELSASAGLPVLASAAFDVEDEADAYLDVSQCGHGIAWIDDFCLGRFWNIGPQHALYVPSPLLKPGRHRITVLDLECEHPSVSLIDHPLFTTED